MPFICFAALLAVYLTALWDTIEQLTTPDPITTLGPNVPKPQSPLKHSLWFQVIKTVLRVVTLVFIVSCTVFCLELLGEIPA